jgi:ferredoxin
VATALDASAVTPTRAARDEAVAQRLCAVSAELTGVVFDLRNRARSGSEVSPPWPERISSGRALWPAGVQCIAMATPKSNAPPHAPALWPIVDEGQGFDELGREEVGERSSGGRPLMRLVVDLNRCQGYAQCVFLAPDVFELRGNEALHYDLNPDDAQRLRVLRAAAACPVQAILVEQLDEAQTGVKA